MEHARREYRICTRVDRRREVGGLPGTPAGDDRNRGDSANRRDQLEVEPSQRAVGVHRVQQDLTGTQLGRLGRPRDHVDPGALPTAVSRDLEAGRRRSTSRVDGQHDALGPEAVSGFRQQRWPHRWAKLTGPNGHTCYGQWEDAGPAQEENYNDSGYVFGANDKRPTNPEFGGAGLDVSPALNGCLGYKELDGDGDKISWQFVDDIDVPAGPWKTIVTTSPAKP